MPNWVTNIVTMSGEHKDIEAVKDLLRIQYEDYNGEMVDGISFDKLIHMPKELDITCPAQTEEEKKQAARNLEEYGARDWYDWRCQNWGTKWDACRPQMKDNIIWFDTAWGMPEPFFIKLSETFPNVLFTVEWADEDIGTNCGKLEFWDGDINDCEMPETELESYALAFNVLGYDADYVANDEVKEWFTDDMWDFIDEVAEYMKEHYPTAIRC